jgi:hypothetical protein
MKTVRFIGLAILLASLLAACGGPVSVPPTLDVNVIVAQTSLPPRPRACFRVLCIFSTRTRLRTCKSSASP